MAFKIVVSEPKSKKAWQKEIEAPGLIGRKIGDQVNGSLIGLNGFTLEITGGSDKDGFPMRYDLPGTNRKRILLSKGPGFKSKRKGMRKRKSVRGNIVSEEIMQINLKVVEGEGDIPKILGVQPKEKKEEKQEQPAEEKKVEKSEKKKEEVKEKIKEEPEEEKKEEVKPEETKEEPKEEENKENGE